MREKQLSALLPKGFLDELPAISGGADVHPSDQLEPTELTPATEQAHRLAQQKKQVEQENMLQLVKQHKPEPA
jgi:hypothetical protein